MWLFTKYGFFSVVCAREGNGWIDKVDPNILMVRARSKQHLDNLIARFPELKSCKKIETPHNDYRYRLFCEKATWSKIMMALSEELDYDNFKNKVKQHLGDKKYENCLGDVWSTMYRFQSTLEGKEGSISAWDVLEE